MKTSKLEDMIAEWLKPVPHLPVAGQKWIAENVWWIALIGVILSAIGVLVMIGTVLTAVSILGTATSIYGYSVAPTYTGIAPSYTGWMVLSSLVSAAFMVVIVIMMAKAISHLKLSQKSGWNLLFLSSIIGAIASVVGSIINFSLGSIISSVITAVISLAISMYFLYEIRSYFNVTAKPTASPQK